MSCPRKVEKKISEDGVRSCAALEGELLLALRFWRLGALVFRPDSFRKSHKVGHLQKVATDSSLGGQRFCASVAHDCSRPEERFPRKTSIEPWDKTAPVQNHFNFYLT
jgi:hypothetical protein